MKTFQSVSESEASTGTLAQSQLRLGIGAIFRNESPYILEWVAYHRVIGIQRFFIADNESDDGSTELLKALDAAGVIDYLHFPRVADTPPQLAAYAEILKRYGMSADWIAFIDADEFLLPTDGQRTVLSAIQNLDNISDAGAIAVNWSIYGSSNHVEENNLPIIERFSRRAEKACSINNHYKSIVRTKAVLRVGKNPHCFFLKRGYHLFDPSGNPLVGMENRPGLSREVKWEKIRLNHYVVKSWNEFALRKRARGRATLVSTSRPASFFSLHDRNDVDEPMPVWLLEATKAEMKKLRSLAGLDEPTSDASSKMRQNIDKLPQNSTASIPPAMRRIRGALDKVTIDNGLVTLTGWALDNDGGPVPFLAVRLGTHVVRNSLLDRRERPDVVKAIPNSHRVAGYSISFPLAAVPVEAVSADRLAILAGSSPEAFEFEVSIGSKETTALAEIGRNWRLIFADVSMPLAAAGKVADPMPVTRVGIARQTINRGIYVPQANIGNLVFRLMAAKKIRDQLEQSEMFGFSIPEFGIDYNRGRAPNFQNPIITGHKHQIDINSIIYRLKTGANDGLVFDCYVQRLEYFFESRSKFQSMLSSKETGYPTESDDLVINVRSGEIIDGLHPDYMPVPIFYYVNLLRETGLSPVFVGQLERNWYTDALRSNFPMAKFISSNSWIYDFQTIRNSKNIVISISSFAWISAWLSERSEKIYIPALGLLNPDQRPDIDLLPINDERYIIDRFPILKYTGSHEQRSAILRRSVNS